MQDDGRGDRHCVFAPNGLGKRNASLSLPTLKNVTNVEFIIGSTQRFITAQGANLRHRNLHRQINVFDGRNHSDYIGASSSENFRGPQFPKLTSAKRSHPSLTPALRLVSPLLR